MKRLSLLLLFALSLFSCEEINLKPNSVTEEGVIVRYYNFRTDLPLLLKDKDSSIKSAANYDVILDNIKVELNNGGILEFSENVTRKSTDSGIVENFRLCSKLVEEFSLIKTEDIAKIEVTLLASKKEDQKRYRTTISWENDFTSLSFYGFEVVSSERAGEETVRYVTNDGEFKVLKYVTTSFLYKKNVTLDEI